MKQYCMIVMRLCRRAICDEEVFHADLVRDRWQTFIGPGEREKVKSALRELEEIGNRYKHIGNQGMEQLANSITPRLRNLLDVVIILNSVAMNFFFYISICLRVSPSLMMK